jgi:hypothetical protein
MTAPPETNELYVPDIDEVERLVLETLLIRHPALVALDELLRELCHPEAPRTVPEMFVREAVESLLKDGLAHQLGTFVFASYSAVRGDKLKT